MTNLTHIVAGRVQLGLLLCVLVAPAAAAQNSPWPQARARHHMVYDSAAHQVLMLGGARRETGDSALWIWTGAEWLQSPSTLRPAPNDAMAFDDARGRLIAHGGFERGDETWEWDRSAWRRVAAEGPGARGHHELMYDPVRKLTFLFGHNDDTPLSDTWAWDGATWRRVATDGPPPLGVFAAAFDRKRNVTVVFGGCCASGLRGDTWEWDGERWTQITTSNAPAPRYDAGMAYDPVRERIVLFGGTDRSENLGDTWEFDGKDWIRRDIPGPPARNSHAMVHDPRANAVLLFGGRVGRTHLDDFWMYDGAWRQIGAGR